MIKIKDEPKTLPWIEEVVDTVLEFRKGRMFVDAKDVRRLIPRASLESLTNLGGQELADRLSSLIGDAVWEAEDRALAYGDYSEGLGFCLSMGSPYSAPGFDGASV